MTDNRYVKVICPLCMDESPVCDQVADPHRRVLLAWYREHMVQRHPRPDPIWQAVSPPDEVCLVCNGTGKSQGGSTVGCEACDGLGTPI